MQPEGHFAYRRSDDLPLVVLKSDMLGFFFVACFRTWVLVEEIPSSIEKLLCNNLGGFGLSQARLELVLFFVRYSKLVVMFRPGLRPRPSRQAAAFG
jgi:hypothetical protein